MEHVVALPAGGTVLRVAVRVGDTVRQGDVLATVEHSDGDAADGDRAAARPRRRPRRPGRGAAAPRAGPRRAPPRGGGAAARPGPAHRPGEHRRPRRPGQLRRVRRARVRRPAAPPQPGGPAASAPRPTAWSAGWPTSTATCRTRAQRGRRRGLRLHRAGRHPGHAQPPQEGPAARAGRAAAAAGRALRRGRRRPARRHRHAGRLRRSTPRPSRCSRRLSGLVPLVGIAAGRCFAGNAALLGCCDVIIATEDANIGMGGPAMIEGGGLGVVAPEEIGPIDVQRANGVVDIAVADEAGRRRRGPAVPLLLPGAGRATGRRPTSACCAHLVPENRLRVYDMRAVLRRPGRRRLGARAARRLRRRDGHRAGPDRGRAARRRSPTTRRTSAGAIDADAADKAARFLQLCDAHGLPVVSLCDTPGLHGRPRGRADGHRCATSPGMFVTGANLSVPFVTVVAAQGLRPRRAGDGRRQLQGAAVHRRPGRPASSAAMGLEGAVRLGYPQGAGGDRGRRPSATPRSTPLVAAAYERGQGASTWPPTSRSTTSSTPPTPAAGSPR